MQDPESPSSGPVMSNLTDLIQVVHTCLGQHQGMQSTEIKDAAKNLMNCFQSKLILVMRKRLVFVHLLFMLQYQIVKMFRKSLLSTSLNQNPSQIGRPRK